MPLRENKRLLLGMDIDEMSSLCRSLGCNTLSGFHLAYGVYKQRVKSLVEIERLKITDRMAILNHADIGLISPSKEVISKDGTKKYLFEYDDGKLIETAYIPDAKRKTLCISSQCGCRMGCGFCSTGTIGFKGNLTAHEIVNQYSAIRESEEITHLVIMGMGEPCDNVGEVIKAIKVFVSEWGYALGSKNITISTVGLLPEIGRLIDETKCNIAISLHSPFPEQRKMLMPAQNHSDIRDVVSFLKRVTFEKHRRLSFEYLVLKDVNDTDEHVKAIAHLLDGLKCHVNLIPWNSFDASPYRPSDSGSMMTFRNKLDDLGIMTTIRKSRGADIEAACGLLAAKTK